MRVLFVGNFFTKASYCVDLAQQLETRGHEVVTVSTVQNRLFRLLDMAVGPWRRRRLYDVAHVDVFSGRSFFWAEAATWSLRRVGKPVVLTLHGGGLPSFARSHLRRVARLLKGAAAVTAPSGYLAEAMRGFRADIRIIPNALDLSRYPYRPRKSPKPNLLWLRAFHRIYAPEVAIRVLALLARDIPEVHLRMVGPDKDGSLEKCRRLAQELGVVSRVSFVPGVQRAQVPQVVSQGDIFLNTTTVDNTPVSLMEAMACGLCLVSTEVGGVPHLVQDGQEGILIPWGETEAMAAAVRRLLRDPALAGRLSANARKRAEGFDWRVVLPQWERLFSGLVQEGATETEVSRFHRRF